MSERYYEMLFDDLVDDPFYFLNLSLLHPNEIAEELRVLETLAELEFFEQGELEARRELAEEKKQRFPILKETIFMQGTLLPDENGKIQLGAVRVTTQRHEIFPKE